MKNTDYKPRVIDAKIQDFLSAFGAISIEGPKWCGKTWSSRYHSKSEILIGDPRNNFQNRKLAELAPSTVLEGEVPRLIDEWQEVPSLWDAIRYEVDARGQHGQFIITGSATPTHKGILHSGAGRIARLQMRTMSLYESEDSCGKVSLSELLMGKEWHDIDDFISSQAESSNKSGRKLCVVPTGNVDLEFLMWLIVRGGWPAVINSSSQMHSTLSEQYISAILEDDVFRMDGVKRDTKKMMLLLKSLARNESTTCSNKVLQRDIKEKDDGDVNVETVAEYLDIFKRLFLTDNQPPFSTKVRSSMRLKQSEKRHFIDPSLACALLKLNVQKLIGDLNTAGFMFESLCERDLLIYADVLGGDLYHYQDYANKEIDAVIELPDSEWFAFEIKLGSNQIDEAANKLLDLTKSIKKEGGKVPKRVFVICGLSNAAYQREDGVIVLPITALRP